MVHKGEKSGKRRHKGGVLKVHKQDLSLESVEMAESGGNSAASLTKPDKELEALPQTEHVHKHDDAEVEPHYSLHDTPYGLLDASAAENADLTGVTDELNEFKNDLVTFQMELAEHNPDHIAVTDLVALQDFHFPISPDMAYFLVYQTRLDAEGLRYLDIYREQYCKFILIGLDSLNYFLKTFLALAADNDAILYAVTAWGGFYHELGRPKGDFSRPWHYMQAAAKHMCNSIGDSLTPTTNHDFFVLFAFYLIFIGIEVCTGDVRNWGGFLSQCAQLIQAHGGLAKVLAMFHHLNDIKWLISDFQFHDVLSSNALVHGTKYLIDEYRAVLPEDRNYGIDPLQGMVGPIYHLLGEIANAKVELRKKWNTIQDYMATHSDVASLMRYDHYDEIERTAQDFEAKIAATCPWKSHIGLLELDPKEFDIQMALFELYVCVCRMQLATCINQMQPSSVHQQRLLMKALPLVDFLLPTKVKVALSLLLLTCGITCVHQVDRDAMTRRFRQHLNQYEIGNFQRIEELVVEAWARNPDGNQCIDWAELGDEKGWDLYVG